MAHLSYYNCVDEEITLHSFVFGASCYGEKVRVSEKSAFWKLIVMFSIMGSWAEGCFAVARSKHIIW